tara:strand:+ start:791 stop:1009 length:219 start_codon:yes stop_codon:yes gene_type:complete
MKRTEEQAKKHKEYMKKYYQNNEEKRKANNKRNNKRGLEKISCVVCQKMITRANMKRHAKVKHPKDSHSGGE